MAEGLNPLVVEIRAKASELFSTLKDVKSETRSMVDDTGKETQRAASGWQKMQDAGKAAAIGIGGAAITAGTTALKMGMDFQESMTTLVTGAGESEENIKQVSDGILNMAGKVGVSADDLAKGMYLIESAGYHGADGLKVLQSAAEGARVGNADMKTVADGVTTALTDYSLGADQAATVTSKLVATVGQGKTTMGDLSGALATVLPIASSAKVGLDQVLGAMASMTAKGTPAADAATYLKQTIAQLSNPTTKAAKEMEDLGLSSIDVSSKLGERGLTGTLSLLTDAIKNHMGPEGTVLIDNLKKTAKAGGDMNAAIAALPPTQQTYVAALADMVGGTKSMQAALMLTGDGAETFQQNVDTISKAVPEADGHVKGFAETQKDLKTKLDNARAGIEAMITKVGLALIPAVTRALEVGEQWGNWLLKHKVVLFAVAGVIGSLLTLAITAWVAKLIWATLTHAWHAAQFILNMGKMAVTATVQFAKIIAEGAKWVAETAAQVGKVIAHGAMWAAENAKNFASAVADYARYTAAGETWLAEVASKFKGAISSGAEWVGEHARQIGEAIADIAKYVGKLAWRAAMSVIHYGAIAIAATAAFIAENAATLGIILVIGLLVAAIIWLATHWQEAWDWIKKAAQWAYEHVIKPVGEFIMNNVIHPIGEAISWLGGIWQDIWHWIGNAIQWVHDNVIAPIGSAIHGALDEIGGVIGWLGGVWSDIWDGITGAIRDAYNWISGIIDDIVGAVQNAIDWLRNLISEIGNASSAAQDSGGAGGFGATMLGYMGWLPSKDEGGWIPGATGQQVLMYGHGQEYVLSTDMLAGRKPIDPQVAAKIAATAQKQAVSQSAPSMSAQAFGGSPQTTGGMGAPVVNVVAQTNASAAAIASEVGWKLRLMAS